MEDILKKAKEYAKKIDCGESKTILHYMTGYQNCSHQPGKVKLQEIRNNFRENGKPFPPQLEKAFTEIEMLLDEFE